MEQHPIPRNVTGFKFQLIGSMTLKQFAYLAFGLAIAFVVYKSPLSIFRYPLAAFFALLGVALAFIPIQERPLDIWIVNFIKSVYAPTQYVWRKEPAVPDYLEGPAHATSSTTPQPTGSNQTRQEPPVVVPKQTKSVPPAFSKPVAAKPPVLATPSKPGYVSGVVQGKNVLPPDLVINIKNQTGNVVRILKTNPQGQFALNLPLPTGQYLLEAEDMQKKHHFNPVSFTINGGINNHFVVTEL